jgi:SnoaL-like domain
MEISEAISVIVDTFNRDDIEGFIAICAPDIELRSLRGLIEDAVYRGHHELRVFERDLDSVWSERHMDALGVETREDTALLLARLRMRGRASGVLAERDVAITIRLTDGLISRFAVHDGVDAARRALGWTD